VEEEIDLGVEGRKVETGVRSLHCLPTTLDARENEVKRADIEKNTQGGYLWIVSTRLRLKTNKTPAFGGAGVTLHARNCVKSSRGVRCCLKYHTQWALCFLAIGQSQPSIVSQAMLS
jgi:hypothetical protein